MKVLLLNGSRREMGCTYTALTEVAQALQADGIETEIIQGYSRKNEDRRWHRPRFAGLLGIAVR